MKQTCLDIVIKAREGDRTAREFLVQNSFNFIIKTASRNCHRYLDPDNDDEVSIAMIAFNDAIDSYDHMQPAGFYSYAGLVIRRRLVDYYRKEKKHFSVPLETQENASLEYRASFDEYLKEQEAGERRSEIIILAGELKHYQISFNLLERKSPKHRDTRKKLVSVARIIANNPFLYGYMAEKKRLPQKELSAETGYSIRFLERGRVYIISIVLIMKHPELIYLRSYINESPADVEKRSENNDE